MDGLWGSGCKLGSKFRALFSPLNNLLGHPAHKDPLERVCVGGRPAWEPKVRNSNARDKGSSEIKGIQRLPPLPRSPGKWGRFIAQVCAASGASGPTPGVRRGARVGAGLSAAAPSTLLPACGPALPTGSREAAGFFAVRRVPGFPLPLLLSPRRSRGGCCRRFGCFRRPGRCFSTREDWGALVACARVWMAAGLAVQCQCGLQRCKGSLNSLEAQVMHFAGKGEESNLDPVQL